MHRGCLGPVQEHLSCVPLREILPAARGEPSLLGRGRLNPREIQEDLGPRSRVCNVTA